MKASTIFSSITIFASAFLIFWAQPLIAKQLTPYFGGAPMVWNTMLFFFQTLLLAGYAYANLIIRRLPIKPGIILHMVLVFGAIVFLPIGFNNVENVPDNAFPYQWLIIQSFWSIGVPFFILASTAPLLQSWYSRTSLNKEQPYFLYSISNAGSFAALFAFLFLLEFLLGTETQLRLWSIFYFVTAFVMTACAFMTFKKDNTPILSNQTSDKIDLKKKIQIIGNGNELK